MANQSLFQKNHGDIEQNQLESNRQGLIFRQNTEDMLISLFDYKRADIGKSCLTKVVEKWEGYSYILYFTKDSIELRVVNEKEFKRIASDAFSHSLVNSAAGIEEIPIERLVHEMIYALRNLIVFNYKDDYQRLKEPITSQELHAILKDLYNDQIQFVINNHKRCIELGGL